MSKINNIIGEAYFELIRSRIATILSDEFANQKTLNEIALAEEEAKPTPDQSIIDSLKLNLSAIPDKIWEERFKRPEQKELIDSPVVNVIFLNAPLTDNVTVSTQIGDDTYTIQVYTGNKEPEEEKPKREGDSLSSIKLHRTLAMIRAILMNQNYQQLGFDTSPYPIGYVRANNIQIGQPDNGADDANNAIMGKIDLVVKVSEGVEQITGVELALSQTTVKLYDTEKGYFWTNESK